MNSKKLEIQIYEGMAGASLVFLIATCVRSFMSLKKYLDFKNEKPLDISSIRSNLNKPIQIEAKIHSASEEVFQLKNSYQFAYLDFRNSEQSISVNFKQFERFHIDSENSIEIVPVLNTIWTTTHYYTPSNPPLLTRIFYFLTIPIHFLRYFLGIRLKNGEYSATSNLKPGDSIFICGVGKLIGKKVEVTADMISVSKESITQGLFSTLNKNFLFLLLPAGILLYSYIKIRKLLNISTTPKKVLAVNDLLCVSCKSKPASLLIDPCNHLCLCQSCSEKASHCPICDSFKIGVYRVYQ
jgi:hypothetical protein